MPAYKPQNEPSHRPKRPAVHPSETMGLVLIACVLLVLTLVRYWHNIHWSWR